MATAQATTNHDEIREWVEARGGHPARVKRTGSRKDPGVLRIDFPGFSGEDTLEEIEWDEFFEWFDRNRLAMLLSEEEGNRFSKLVARSTVRAAKKSSSKKTAKKPSSRKAAASSKKSSAKKASPSTKKASSATKAASTKKSAGAKKATSSRKATSRGAAPASGAGKKKSSKKSSSSATAGGRSGRRSTSAPRKAAASKKASSTRKASSSKKTAASKKAAPRKATSTSRKRTASSTTTTNHDEIRQWVESRGGFPAHVRQTGRKRGDLGVLRIDYPGYSGRDTLERIDWEQWFDAFDRNKLAFLYQDKRGSRFSKLVNR